MPRPRPKPGPRRPAKRTASNAALAAFALFAAGLWWRVGVPEGPGGLRNLRAPSSARLAEAFKRRGYDLDRIDGGVPRVALASFPSDLGRQRVDERKRLFLLSVLPLALAENARILARRKEAEALVRSVKLNRSLSRLERTRLERLALEFGVRGDPAQEAWAAEALLRRLDAVPVSLVLAQAAVESAWGTSRFAQEGRALFGEWTYRRGGGIVPNGRREGARHEVKAFPDLKASVASYLHRLNAGAAYAALRTLRVSERRGGRTLSGSNLAYGLRYYSQRRDAYVKDIRTMIRQNRLDRFESARLRE